MPMGFEDFEPIFGEPKAKWSTSGSIPLHPFLFYVNAPDPSCLRIIVSDFRFSTWEAIRSVQQLEDMNIPFNSGIIFSGSIFMKEYVSMNFLIFLARRYTKSAIRESIGIGGSWSEFVNYVIASLKSEDVKLVLEEQSRSEGAAYAKLVAQKSKGMPLISISLAKLADIAASGAIANLSLELFKSFKSMQNLFVKEQEGSYQLTKVIAAEKEKNEIIQSQLELYSKRPKLQKTNVSDKADVSDPAMSSDTLSGNGFQNSPDKVAAREKVTNRVVPAYRRARVRGVLLQDTEDEKDN